MGYAVDPLSTPRDRLEDIDSTDDVDPRAERRVGLDEWQLERGQVDDMSDGVRVERLLQCGQVGDVAVYERDPRQLVGCHDQLEAARVAHQVEDHRLDAVAHQVAHGPGADAAQRAGNQKTIL